MRTKVFLVVTPFIPVGRQWEQIPLSLYREHFPELHPIRPRKCILSKVENNILKYTPDNYCLLSLRFVSRL
jgi:hypothetical protein